MKNSRWTGLVGLLAGVLWSGVLYAQDITSFQNGHITFENTDTNLYYRIEFKPNLTEPGEWLVNLPGNIKSADAEVTVPVGVFYRVAGSEEPFAGGDGGGGAGTATEADLLDGRTAWVDDVQLTGTMPDRGAVYITPGTSAQTIQAGYHNGSGTVAGDANLVAANIRAGASIFGVAGSAVLASGNATAADVLAGKTFSNASGSGTGTMPERAGPVAAVSRSRVGNMLRLTPQPGFYSGDHMNYVTFTDDNWVEANIRSGVWIFGKSGTLVPASGNATAADVLVGKTFSNASGSGTGTYVPPIGMVLIPGGTNAGTDPDFGAYNLTVDSFHMDRTPVTKVQWDEVYNWAIHADRGANVYTFDNAGLGKDGAHPVHTVNWYDVVKWCNARSEKDGRTPVYYTDVAMTQVYRTGDVSEPYVKTSTNGYRLPTDVQWHYAARGGLVGKRFPWGDSNEIQHTRANYCSSSSYSYDTSPTRGYHPIYEVGSWPYTSPVGSFAPNGYGLYDMAGNVWEWCYDWHPSSVGSYRVIRGGSWFDVATHCRVGFRNYYWPGLAGSSVGFRAVLPPGQ